MQLDFAAIVQHICQVVIIVDPELTIVWANQQAAQVAGCHPVGHKCYRLYQGRDTPCDNCHTLESFASGRTIPNQSTVTYADGSQRHFDGFTLVVARDAAGQPSRVAEVAGEVPAL